ncbi:MAG: FkbM family methyltransferase [Chthoniobacterales bacterium]
MMKFPKLPALFRRRKNYKKESYSQEGEDVLLAEMLDMRRKGSGFYVDVGAHHPLRFSNTALFHKHGWRGINIDATPDSMKNFARSRPHDINLELAVSEDEGVRKMYLYNEPALNGIDCDRTVELANSSCRLLEIRDVPTAALRTILAKHAPTLPSPNFLTIDVEGHEMEVLKSNDWKKFRFEYLLVEVRSGDLAELLRSETTQFLKTLDYQAVAFTGRTAFYKARPSRP